MCKGMWGYYLDDGFQNYRKKTDNYLYNDKDNEITSSAHQITLEETISDNLRRVLQEFSKSSNYEKQISESPDTNLLLSLIDNSIEQHPDNVFLQEIKYFAQLYANDRSPIESLPHNFAIRQKYNGERENKDSKPTGIPMSPHDRWYDFNSDRLLSPQTLVEGTGSIYLARERYGQKKRGRKNNLEGIKLSTIILELYIDQMNRIRLSEEYRVSDKDTKRIIRGTESQKFILQLSDSNSKLRNFIKDKDVNAEEELNNVLKQMITEDSDVSDLKIFCVRSF